MSGSAQRFGPLRPSPRAALTLVFGCALATAAATGSLPRDPEPGPGPGTRAVSSTVAPVDHDEIEDAAAEAEADGKSVKDAAEEVVSRSGDRWGAVYDQREYEEFEQALDGTSHRRRALRPAHRPRRRHRLPRPARRPRRPGRHPHRRSAAHLDGRAIGKRPVAEVVALLRGDGTGAAEGSRVELGLVRKGRSWTETWSGPG